jgi:hypothetical protein
MAHTVFFSWQASRSPREGRNLIERALKQAIVDLSTDAALEEALRDGLGLDKDTKNVPGSPPIFATILEKIDKAAVFIPDLTSVAKREDGELVPNPNVLIEYGWALKALGYHRIIPVMNTAYGDPQQDRLPFDMAHLRFPITYCLPEGASDDDRRTTRAALTKELGSALRTFFDSDEFKSRLPKPEEPPPFPRQVRLNGRARFRSKGMPLGTPRDSLRLLTGQPESANLKLGDGPAYWFRMMPKIDSGRRWSVLDIKDKTLELAMVPLLHMSQSIGFVRGADGGGYFSVEGEDTTWSVAYVFTTGEIWLIDSWLARVPNYVQLDEAAFTATLSKCATFLSERFGLAGPYHWEAGFEGISGRMLSLPGQYIAKGTAVGDVVEASGEFQLGDDAVETLRAFFEKVYDCFGLRRSL